MHRSSQSISNLAAALAKAQIELVNPEKSLTGTIQSAGSGRKEQTFSYASLSSGLDIVRKTLGPCFGRMDRLGLAGLLSHRDGDPASDGCGPDLCPALRAVHAGRHCRRR